MLFFITAVLLSAQDASFFEQGRDLLMANKPDEAAIMLKAAVDEEPGNERAFLYLAFSYEQMGKHDRAVETLKRGLQSSVLYRKDFYFNLGNNYFKLGMPDLAEEMFTQAIRSDGRFSGAFLNRANSRMKAENYEGALADYRMYLSLAPDSPQKENINALISLLTSYIAEEEQRKLAEEQREREEAERQQQLMDSVLQTLDSIGGDTRNLSADSEDIIEYEDGLDILE